MWFMFSQVDWLFNIFRTVFNNTKWMSLVLHVDHGNVVISVIGKLVQNDKIYIYEVKLLWFVWIFLISFYMFWALHVICKYLCPVSGLILLMYCVWNVRILQVLIFLLGIDDANKMDSVSGKSSHCVQITRIIIFDSWSWVVFCPALMLSALMLMDLVI